MVATDSDTERSISYDLDGNVTSLTRYDGSGIPETLSLSHAGGRLASVNGGTFRHDSNGNLTFDGRRGLEFTYNCVNLPKSATAADGRSLTYVCLSDGTKVSAMSGDGGLRYRGSFVYRVDPDGNETLESVAWDEGRIVLSQVADSLAAGPALLSALPDEPVDSMDVDALRGPRDLLYVRDHLGSVRSVLDVSLGLAQPELLEQSDYLPFGTRVEPAGAPSLDESLWRFSGKEEQRLGGLDLGLLDFGARWYDPALCRWTTPDPLAAKYPGLSPYCYCANNPLSIIDDGDLDLVLLGTNNSSVTFKTDLVNLSVDVGGLGIDWKGSHVVDGDKYLGAALDIAGVFDPTGIADVTNAGIQYRGGDKWGAVISTAGVIPYVGDLAKAGRIGKDIRVIDDAVGLSSFTSRNFRKNLSRLTGINPKDMQAHHKLPQKFRKFLKEAGINVDDPRFGCWLESTKHNKGSYQYNKKWGEYLNDESHTKDEILSKIDEFMKEVYGE